MDHWFLISSLSSQLQGACTPERWELFCRLISHCTRSWSVATWQQQGSDSLLAAISANLSWDRPGSAARTTARDSNCETTVTAVSAVPAESLVHVQVLPIPPSLAPPSITEQSRLLLQSHSSLQAKPSASPPTLPEGLDCLIDIFPKSCASKALWPPRNKLTPL